MSRSPFAKAQLYARPGPDDETIAIDLPGRDTVLIPVAVAYALRYDLTRAFPEEHKTRNNRDWWRILVGRCVKCCDIDRFNCKCRRKRSDWATTQEGIKWSHNYRIEWTRRERAAATRDGRCTRCFVRTPPSGRRICLPCSKIDRDRRARKKAEQEISASTTQT